MNRSLILIIADFLLLSMLAMARFEPVEEVPPDSEVVEQSDAITANGQEELIQVLQMSLEAERQSHLDLSRSFEDTSDTLKKTREELEREQEEAERLAEEKATLEARKRELEDRQQELESVAREHESLQQEYSLTRSKLEEAMEARASLAEELSEAKASSSASVERLKLLQQQLQERDARLQQLDSALEEAESAARVAELEKQKVETDLKIAATEKSMLAENLRKTESEKARAEQQAEVLAENVGSLASSQSQMQRELKEMQPLSLNRIFELYQANRVQVTFKVRRRALLGEVDRSEVVQSVPVILGGQPYLVMHREETPLKHSGILSLEADIRRQDGQHFETTEAIVLASDPRLLAIPLPRTALSPNSLDAFPVSRDPLRFPEAVAIGGEGTFGDILMKQHPDYRRYFLRDTKLLSSLPGEVSADRGFHVFAKTGRYLGMMVNGRYVVLAEDNNAQASVGLGRAFVPEQWESAHDMLESREDRLPLELR